MDYLAERVAYIRGLMDGLKICDDTDEGKVLVQVVDLLDDMVDEIMDLKDSKIELDEYVQTLDEDLSEVEEELFGGDYDDDSFEDSQFIEVECPNCRETVYFSSDLFDGNEELSCPNCEATIYDEDDIVVDEE